MSEESLCSTSSVMVLPVSGFAEICMKLSRDKHGHVTQNSYSLASVRRVCVDSVQTRLPLIFLSFLAIQILNRAFQGFPFIRQNVAQDNQAERNQL